MDDQECDTLLSVESEQQVECNLAAPSKESYAVARDKESTMLLARELGVAVPRTESIVNSDSTDSVLNRMGYPAVLKPARSSGSRGFRVLDSDDSLAGVSHLFLKYGKMILQEYIPSDTAIGVSLLFNHGEPRAIFTHERIIQFPAGGGPSVIRESVRHEEAEADALTLMEALDWHGVAMVEFRIDKRTGKPVLMEINPRFWGSLPLAIASGVDFPRLLCDMYENGDIPVVKNYRTGVRCVNLLPFGVSSMLIHPRLSDVSGFIGEAWKSRCFDVESLSDPLPAFGAVLSMMRFSIDREMTNAVFHRQR